MFLEIKTEQAFFFNSFKQKAFYLEIISNLQESCKTPVYVLSQFTCLFYC
jgi:hypothetical protein